jgi:hypothetical protein
LTILEKSAPAKLGQHVVRVAARETFDQQPFVTVGDGQRRIPVALALPM